MAYLTETQPDPPAQHPIVFGEDGIRDGSLRKMPTWQVYPLRPSICSLRINRNSCPRLVRDAPTSGRAPCVMRPGVIWRNAVRVAWGIPAGSFSITC
jgi:hypothetical protein